MAIYNLKAQQWHMRRKIYVLDGGILMIYLTINNKLKCNKYQLNCTQGIIIKDEHEKLHSSKITQNKNKPRMSEI